MGKKKNGKFGFIDKTGRMTIAFQYDAITDFYEGLAIVRKGDRYGYINKQGKEVLPAIYREAYPFSEGLARVMFFDDTTYTHYFIDKKGNKKFSLPEFCTFCYTFSEGLIPIRRDGKYGFMDTLGNTVITPKFSDVRDFSEGLCAVTVDDKEGYIDKKGNTVIPFKYDKAYDFYKRIALVYLNGKYGYVDKNGIEYWED